MNHLLGKLFLLNNDSKTKETTTFIENPESDKLYHMNSVFGNTLGNNRISMSQESNSVVDFCSPKEK